MIDITKLVSFEEQLRIQTLCDQLITNWQNVAVPDATTVLQSSTPDAVEVLPYISGRRSWELPFDDAYFCTMTPLAYMTESAQRYYVCGYILESLRRALAASDNPWLGMDIPVIHAIDTSIKLTRTNLTLCQRRCVLHFLELVRDNAEFFFCKERISTIANAIACYSASNGNE